MVDHNLLLFCHSLICKTDMEWFINNPKIDIEITDVVTISDFTRSTSGQQAIYD